MHNLPASLRSLCWARAIAWLLGTVSLSITANIATGQAPPPADYPNGRLLVEPLGLKKVIDSSSVLIIDVREAAEYQKGHLPDAIWLDAARWTNESRKPGALENAEIWSELAGAAGIRSDTTVVVYDQSITSNAARIWWLTKYIGHPDARMLNGGIEAWRKAGGATGTDEIKIVASKFEPKFQSEMLANRAMVQAMVGKADSCLLDTRSAAEFTGEQAVGARGGRVPGAKHLEWSELLDPHGRFKSADELTKLFAERNLTDNQRVVTYCQSGGRASVDAFALELMGFRRVRNYYGSWADWSANNSSPIEKDK